MVRIICPKCKKTYLELNNAVYSCPECGEEISQDEENFLAGVQYYKEGDYVCASDCLMKYIVKKGAESHALFYKALCDGFVFDEDTVSLQETYDKLYDCLKNIPQADFPEYLALANDEAEKLEKTLAQLHIRLFAEADAEKIKKEVSVVINLQNDAKAFRVKLNALALAYNEDASRKISVKLSQSFLVEPELATEVGNLKYAKVAENVTSHTVFTGILSTDIKNLEIYYRCIVMFFKKNRQKYEFLMASAEKFAQLAVLLEEGQYTSIKGTAAIGEKLKNAGYDFFQESLKDQDDEFETQTQTVVIIELPEEEEEAPAEAELEDISSVSTLEEVQEAPTEYEDISSSADTAEAAPQELQEDIPEESHEDDIQSGIQENETESADAIDLDALDENEEDEIIEIDIEEVSHEVADDDDVVISVIEIDGNEAEESEKAEEASDEAQPETAEDIKSEIEVVTAEPDTSSEPVKKAKRKKSYGPFIAVFLIIAAIIGIICLTVIPDKLNERNYEKAKQLSAEGKYEEAAQVYLKLDDYEDSQSLYKASKYAHAQALEEQGSFLEAKAVYDSLGIYNDSMAKSLSCTYNLALTKLDDGKFDEAKSLFETITDYSDSKDRINECSYKKALAFIDDEQYEKGIEILLKLGEYSNSQEMILEAKLRYVNANLSKDNATTIAYLEDLVGARYKNSAEIKKNLLGVVDETNKPDTGTDVPSTGEDTPVKEPVVTVINYSQTDSSTDIGSSVDHSKAVYFHAEVNDASYYGQTLTVKYRTQYGYSQQKSFILSEVNNVATFMYKGGASTKYTVTFTLLDQAGNVVAEETITIN